MVEKLTVGFRIGGKSETPLKLAFPNGLTTVADLMPVFHKLFDRIIDLEAKGKSVTCGPNCGTCCRQLVPISLPEAFYLRSLLNGLKPKMRKRVRQRIAATLNKTKDAGLLTPILNPRENEAVDSAYFRLGLPCPFLEENSCSIHPQRPLTCRDYLVTSEKQYCRDPLGDDVNRIRIKRNMAAMLAVLTAGLYQIPKAPIPLFYFMDYTEKSERLNELKWPARTMLERFLSVLVQLNDEDLQISFQMQ